MAKITDPAYLENLKLYEALVSSIPEVERKGATMPYTSRNGHMFSFLDKTGKMSLRLPTQDREAFLSKFKTKLTEQYGTIMKEYVDIPASLLQSTGDLEKYYDISFEYIGTLMPKATRRKK